MTSPRKPGVPATDHPSQPATVKPSPMQAKLLANIQRGVAADASSRAGRFAQARTIETTTVQAALADGSSQAAALVQGHPATATAATELALRRYVPGMPVAVGMCLEVALDDLLESPVQPRVFFDEDRLAQIKASLAQHGQQQLAQVVMPSPGATKLTLREGHTRRRLLRELGKPTLRVEVVQPGRTEDEEAVLARVVNEQRCAITVFDSAVRLVEFLDRCAERAEPVPLGEALAHRFGLGSASRVSEFTSIGRLPRALQEAMFKAGFKRSTAYLVARYFKRSGELPAALKLVDRIVHEKMPVRRLESLVGEDAREVAPAAPTKPRQKSLAVTLVGGALRGEVKLFDTGVLQLQLKPVDAEQAMSQALHAKLQQLLRELGLEVKAADAPN